MNQNFSFQCIEWYIIFIILKKDGSKIMRKHSVKLVAVGLLASTCITGCGYEVNVTKKEPVKVSEEKEAGKSKADNAEETEKSRKETEEQEESKDNNLEDKASKEDKKERKDNIKASTDKVQLEGVLVSNYRPVSIDTVNNAYAFVEGDIKNSDVIIGLNIQAFDADSDLATQYKVMFNSTFDESIMDKFKASQDNGNMSMDMRLDNSILDGGNVLVMNTSTDVSIIAWGDQAENSDKYSLLVAVFVGPGANDKDNIKEFISNVDVNGKASNVSDAELMTPEEFSEINTEFGDFEEYMNKLKESITGPEVDLDGLGDEADFDKYMDELEEETDDIKDTDIDNESSASDLMSKALEKDWYKDFGVIKGNVYVGFSTKDDFEKATGATPVKTVDSGNADLWYYNLSGCKSFYLVVDDATGRIKSASYEMESDSRPAVSAIKDDYGTPDRDNGYFKYEVEDGEYNSISATFYAINDKVTQIEVSSIIID